MMYALIILLLMAFGCSSSDNGTDASKPVFLEPEIQVFEGKVIFELKATRNFIPEKEYLPSSEDFRVIVFKNNREIWNSSEGMMFMTVIEKVKPQEKGETHTYKMTWKPAGTLSGKFNARLIIPAKPEPYSVTTHFEIEDHE